MKTIKELRETNRDDIWYNRTPKIRAKKGEYVHPKYGVSMKGRKCVYCKKGNYQETDFNDDMNGTLHCTKCNHTVKSDVMPSS